jgi:nuclear receptor subfamily 5 group A protein 3
MIRGIPGNMTGHGHHNHHSSESSATSSPFLVPSHASIYSPDGIKQELIQIPQLSSSTSSPDSSPIPGQNNNINSTSSSSGSHAFAAGMHGSHAMSGHHSSHHHSSHHHHPASLGASAPGSAHVELAKWIGSTSSAGPSGLQGKSGSSSSYLEGGPSSTPTVGVLALEGPTNASKVPQILRDLQMTAPDDKDWQNQLFGLLNNQTYNQCEVDLFELMCKVIDQSLFAQVDWARNSIFFKDLKVSFVNTTVSL